ncbi:hypothetical protein, partial [Geoalkalibacter sp.]|uniref:hypothetical protein n=1 Tax=Geoalkalibacter sp. TaxID=3041440 RepID=UPI00272E6E75
MHEGQKSFVFCVFICCLFLILPCLPGPALASKKGGAPTKDNPAPIAAPAPTINCSDCHGLDVAQRHHETPWFFQGECFRCHEGFSTEGDCSSCHAFGLQNVHHLTPD